MMRLNLNGAHAGNAMALTHPLRIGMIGSVCEEAPLAIVDCAIGAVNLQGNVSQGHVVLGHPIVPAGIPKQ